MGFGTKELEEELVCTACCLSGSRESQELEDELELFTDAVTVEQLLLLLVQLLRGLSPGWGAILG